MGAFLIPLLGYLPGLRQLKLYAIFGTLLFVGGALGMWQLQSTISEWQTRRHNQNELRRVRVALEKREDDYKRQSKLAQDRGTALQSLSEDFTTLKQELDNARAAPPPPPARTVAAKPAAAPAPVLHGCGIDLSLERLRILRAVLERGDRGGK